MNKPEQVEKSETTDFFEAMPMTAGHFVYRDDTIDAEPAENNLNDEIRTTAIITLVLVAVTALALGLLIWKGLNTIKGSNSAVTSSAYEL